VEEEEEEEEEEEKEEEEEEEEEEAGRRYWFSNRVTDRELPFRHFPQSRRASGDPSRRFSRASDTRERASARAREPDGIWNGRRPREHDRRVYLNKTDVNLDIAVRLYAFEHNTRHSAFNARA